MFVFVARYIFCVAIATSFLTASLNGAAAKRITKFVSIQPTAESEIANDVRIPQLRIANDVISGEGIRVQGTTNTAAISVKIAARELNQLIEGDPRFRKRVTLALYEEVPTGTTDLVANDEFDTNSDNAADPFELSENSTPGTKLVFRASVNHALARGKTNSFPDNETIVLPLRFSRDTFKGVVFLVAPESTREGLAQQTAIARYDLPILIADRFVTDLGGPTPGVNLPDDGIDDMTPEQQEIIEATIRTIFEKPGFLVIRPSRRVGIEKKGDNGYYFNVPPRKVVRVRGKARKVGFFEPVNPIVQGSLFLGSGSIEDRAQFASAPRNSTFLTIVEQGTPSIDDPNVLSPERVVYMSLKLEGFDEWKNTLISGSPGRDGEDGDDGAAGTSGGTGPAGPPATPITECNDGIDNDTNGTPGGLIDFPNDPGCTSALDPDEFSFRCSNDVDDDGDGFTDFDGNGGAPDPGCASANSNIENPQCDDGVDNDTNGIAGGFTDFAGGDPGCSSASDNTEFSAVCSNNVDDDGDGQIDSDGFGGSPLDFRCASASSTTENPQCDDGIDNDSDGLIDFDSNNDGSAGPNQDGGCTSSSDNNEFTAPPPPPPPPPGAPPPSTSEQIIVPATSLDCVAGGVNATIGVDDALTFSSVTVQDNTVPFQTLTINFNDVTGNNTITGFQYTGSPVFPVGNGTAAAPNNTNMALSFYLNTAASPDVLTFCGLNLGLGGTQHILQLFYAD